MIFSNIYRPVQDKFRNIALLLSNVLEIYDLSIYGLLAIKLAPLFFSTSNILDSYISSFAVFAVGYIARPLGGFIFGYIGDTWGRKKSLTISILMMSFATGLIAICPTRNEIGLFAPIFLIFLRFLQGVSVGGEYPSSCIFLLEQNERNQGLQSSLAVASAAGGILLGSFICYLVYLLDISWGWRIPFIIGMFIGLSIFFIRKYLTEIPFENINQNKIKQNPIVQALKNKKIGIITLFVTAHSNILFYTTFFYFDAIIEKENQFIISNSNPVYLFVFIITSLLFGLLSAKVSAKKIMLLSSLCCFIICIPIFYMIKVQSLIIIYHLKLILTILTASFMSIQYKLLINLWPVKYRCSGISIFFNIGGAVFGGTAPMVSLIITKYTCCYFASSFYLALIAMLVSILIALIPEKLNHKKYI